MFFRASAPDESEPAPRRGAAAPSSPARTSLVRVAAGVAAGSARRGSGNARWESWTVFMTTEQFDDFYADDPLRFTDPLLYAQLKTEFHHVFHEPSERAYRIGLGQ